MQGSEGGFDWMHAASALGGAVLGALSAIGTFLYRAGGLEPTLRADFQRSIDAAEKRLDEKVDGMTEHFREYFEGIRRQQDEMRLSMERERRTDLKELRDEMRADLREMREENREDMAELKRNVAKILGEKP